MPKLIIGNLRNEHLFAPAADVDLRVRRLAATSSARLAWLAEAGDVLLLPAPLPAGLLADVARAKGFDAERVRVIAAAPRSTPELLTQDELHQPWLLEALRPLVSEGNWTVLPYHGSSSVCRLADALHVPRPELGAFAEQDGSDLLNSKSIFRQLAAGRGLPIAEGAVCATRHELSAAIPSLLAQTGAVIVKQDVNAGGLGNVVVTAERSAGHYQGVSAVYGLGRDGTPAALAERLWRELAGAGGRALVVEAYHVGSLSLFSEYLVRGGVQAPRFLQCGEVRMEQDGGDGELWVGFEIPAPVPPRAYAELIAGSTSFCQLASGLGFRGKMNVDALLLRDGRVLFTEVNGRLGGCTHIHEIAEGLVGPGYSDQWVVLTHNRVSVRSGAEATARLRNSALGFDRERREGALVLNTHDGAGSHVSPLEYMVLARGRERAAVIERAVRDLLADAAEPRLTA